jgi:hypothetical protein
MNNYRLQVQATNMGPFFAFADAWGRDKLPGDVTPTLLEGMEIENDCHQFVTRCGSYWGYLGLGGSIITRVC